MSNLHLRVYQGKVSKRSQLRSKDKTKTAHKTKVGICDGSPLRIMNGVNCKHIVNKKDLQRTVKRIIYMIPIVLPL